jgi:hypothetical protein
MKTTENHMTYEQMYAAFLNKEITAEVWYEYCYAQLDIIMTANKDVFVRLFDR